MSAAVNASRLCDEFWFGFDFFAGIGVGRRTHCGRPQRPSKPEWTAKCPDARPFRGVRLCAKRQSQNADIFKTLRLVWRPQPRSEFSATRNPGAGQDFTNLAASVQLRLRVAVPFQRVECVRFFRPPPACFKNLTTAASFGRSRYKEFEVVLPFHSSSFGSSERSR